MSEGMTSFAAAKDDDSFAPDDRSNGDRALDLPAAILPQFSDTASAPPPALISGGGYRSSGPSGRAMALTAGIHVLLFAALLSAGVASGFNERTERLSTFEFDDTVTPAPPPPETPASPQPTTTAAPVNPVLSAPQPKLVLATATPAMPPTLADPRPVQAAPVEIPAAPAPPAPPAPVTPPDFSAAQLGNAGPSYPYLSRKAREQGVVLLRVLVTPEGRAARLEIRESSGHIRLDKAALDTVRKWRFRPARQGGNPVEAWVLVPVTFSLQ